MNYLEIRCGYNFANVTPMRHFDYYALVDGHEENAEMYGYGATVREALDNLGEIILEHVDDAIHDLMTSGIISKELAEECFVSIDGIAWLPY